MLAGGLLVPSIAFAAPLGPVGEPYSGRYEFVFVGASLTESSDDGTGEVNAACLKSSATAVVDDDTIPSRANLVQATLYVAGSLLNDGADGLPGGNLFDVPGTVCTNFELLSLPEKDALHAAARHSADLEVSFKPPGSLLPVTVAGSPNDLLVDVFCQGGTEGNPVAFFITKIDVTQIILQQGLGALTGEYTVGDFTADVCDGIEAACDQGQSCGAPHTKGNASFGLLLVYEEPTLPVVSLQVYEGLEAVQGGSFERNLTLQGGQISDPAAGSLAFYALEGDISVVGSPAPPCGLSEYIEVDGDEDPSANGVCLNQSLSDPPGDLNNPSGNIFNSTINTQLGPPGDPSCSRGANQCCSTSGTTVCGAAGVDIDRFNISSALAPGATRIRFQYGSGSDRIAMAVVVLSVNVFNPVLELDTRVTVPTALDGFVQLGGTFEYSIAVSNTGNAPATGATVLMGAPAHVENLTILSFPTGAINIESQTGGLYNNGLIRVEDITIPPGEVAEVRAELTVTCAAEAQTLSTTLNVAYNEGVPFEVPADEVVGAGPGLGACEGIDPTGPFAGRLFLIRSLRGGGAPTCASAGAVPLTALLLLPLLLRLRGRRGRGLGHTPWALGLLAAALAFTLLGCGERRGDEPPPEQEPPRNIEDLASLEGTKCDALGLMVEVTQSDGDTFCIDRFEASLDGGELGNAHQGYDDADTLLDGSTTAKAEVALGVPPATGVSWYQAKAACLNAGKRLCTQQEWERACRGAAAKTYPYGNEFQEGTCNGFFNYAEEQPSPTGSLKTCGSDFHVYDMSGNVSEWVDAAVPRVPGGSIANNRVYRGGSYKSNELGLACYGAEFHAPPGEAGQDEARGFRCCSDG